MKSLKLKRKYYPLGTRGIIYNEVGVELVRSIERWQFDPVHPCVPPGSYVCERYASPTHGLVFQLKDVPNRTYIQIHICEGKSGAPLLDYVRPGFLLGCIGLGLRDGVIKDEPAVLDSHAAFDRLMAHLKDDKEFTLIIEEEVQDATDPAR